MADSPGVNVWMSLQLWWRLAIVGVGLIGLMVGEPRFVFFTSQANLLVLVYFLCAVFLMIERRTTDAPAPRLRGGITLWIIVTGIVAHVIVYQGANPLPGLFATDPTSALNNRILFLMHYVTPTMVLIDWLFFGPRGHAHWRNGLLWLVYPAVYAVLSLARAVAFPSATDRFPYPFLDFEALGWLGMLGAIARVAAVIIALAVTMVAVDQAVALALRRHRARVAEPAPAEEAHRDPDAVGEVVAG